ncbi:carboxylating nicotinate-nucleotide diphosphorylase [Teredinibacter franksiae]|uniref:carboxylating nicotinate-nucleotide diphosphorylase n=1 Tax=Teredinibacter franksiae TaxID=2761453 RepID=UPI00162A443E|nr:carboxylating nicotinate-nucleotide diphosphorylase [Teredinibacter franksiae]
MNITLDMIRDDIERNVRDALTEDVGDGDITAELIPASKTDTAEIITREDCTFCGAAWLTETFHQLGGLTAIDWHVKDGDSIKANTKLVTLQGNTRTLLTGERTAMNFLQLLSGIATKASHYAKLVEGTDIKILDTRKTIPGLRTAQKYAVNCGGCHNHRIGLFDAFLIKENHIAACGGISAAIKRAREIAPAKKVEIETESISELKEAIAANADIAMLDNFSEAMIEQAMLLDRGASKFELSGNLTIDNLGKRTELKVDYCSFGDLTKNLVAVDLSMRIS